IALAWQGRLLVERSFGMARLGRSARAESDPLRAPDTQGVDDQALRLRQIISGSCTPIQRS
ncbi:MAG: hypothetical protein RLZZ613_1668, partial [Pseudomonadota bacterium]